MYIKIYLFGFVPALLGITLLLDILQQISSLPGSTTLWAGCVTFCHDHGDLYRLTLGIDAALEKRSPGNGGTSITQSSWAPASSFAGKRVFAGQVDVRTHVEEQNDDAIPDA